MTVTHLPMTPARAAAPDDKLQHVTQAYLIMRCLLQNHKLTAPEREIVADIAVKLPTLGDMFQRDELREDSPWLVKALEVRDKMTLIPVFAMKMTADNADQRHLLRAAGYSTLYGDHPLIMLGYLHKGQATYNPYDWGDSRTMKVAHQYITDNYDTLKDGDVVDVEFILGETTTPKISERFENL